MSDQMADSLVGDFAGELSNIEALMVSCTLGKNRSPAVAMALNDVFSLGHDTGSLRQIYSNYNNDVYQSILEAGERFHAAAPQFK